MQMRFFFFREVMMDLEQGIGQKYRELQTILGEMGSVAIAFSGGVDSSLLVKVAFDVLGPRAVAMIGRSETYPTREFEEAMRFSRTIGIRAVVVSTEETDVLKFQENPPDRCYYCKTELFGKLRAIASQEGLTWMADGTIADDMQDFRPGMRARNEQEIRSPLLEAGFTKEDVRMLSRHLSLPTWDKPSFACLSSRFPYGMSITRETLARVDQAETLFRDRGFRAFRVRFHDQNTARIEIAPTELGRILEGDLREQILSHLKDLGFVYVTLDLQGYRTGSMNEVLSAETKERFTV